MSKRTKLLLKENNQLESQIQNEDNKSALTDIIVYIRSANISPYYQEKVRRDIWEMIVDGEKRGKTAKDIIGDNYKRFCDDVIAEIPKLSKKEYILSLLRDALLSANILLLIWFVSNLFQQIINSTSFYFTVTVGNIICAVLIIISAFGVVQAICKNAFTLGTDNPDKKSLFILFLLLFALMILCICANTFLRFPLFHIQAVIAAAGIILLFILYKVLDIKID